MKKSEKIYRKALSLAKRKNPKLKLVYMLLQEAIILGSHEAMYALGTWYLHGKYVDVDFKKGFQLLRSSLPGNIKEAFYDIAICYETGKGIKANKLRAFEHYLKAALLGDKQSIYEIGRCYYYGQGVKKDQKMADIWLEIADVYGLN